MPPRPVPEIRWSTRDSDALAARLRAFGMAIDPDGRIAFRSATIRLVPDPGPDDRLTVANDPDKRPPTDQRRSRLADVLAVGWATVDRERVAAAMAPGDPGAVEPLPADAHLGAFVLRIGRSMPARLVVEPDTEGRLAATLARIGEAPVAIYLSARPDGLAAYVAGVRSRGGAVSAIRPGPLGPSVILLGGPTWGPHLLVVESRPASPRPT